MAERSQKHGKSSGMAPKNGHVRRTRAPKAVILRLHQELEPNENHPLLALGPDRRAEARQQLLATILARLASGPGKNDEKESTIQDEETTKAAANNRAMENTNEDLETQDGT